MYWLKNKTNRVNFKPHEFKPRFEVMSSDKSSILFISPLAYEKMRILVTIAADEVGWLGDCYRENWKFFLKDIFLPGQTASAANSTLTEDGLSELSGELLKSEEGIEIFNNLRFWGHSHANMGTSPSPQDDEQMSLFVGKDVPWMIRGILNKHGKISLTAFLYEENIIINDLPWTIYFETPENLEEDINAQYQAKVKTAPSYYYMPPVGERMEDHAIGTLLADEYQTANRIIDDEPIRKMRHRHKRKGLN